MIKSIESLESATSEQVQEKLSRASYDFAKTLEEKGIDIGYNPETRTCKTWWGKTLEFDFVAQKGYMVGSGAIDKRKIKVNIIKDTYAQPREIRSNDDLADTCLHEKVHQDIGIIETPLAVLGISALLLTKHFVFAGFSIAGYLFAREFTVDFIKDRMYGKIKS